MPPVVVINFALSVDGKTGAVGENGAHFTSKADLRQLLDHRRRADAILVGRRTLLADNMSLTVPDLPIGQQPWRCVATTSGNIPDNHPFLKTDGGPRHLVDCLRNDFGDTCTVHSDSVTDWIKKQTFSRLLCEGGGALARSLFAADLVDEIHLTWAGHTLFGGLGAPTLSGTPQTAFLPKSRQFELVSTAPCAEGEWFLYYRRRR